MIGLGSDPGLFLGRVEGSTDGTGNAEPYTFKNLLKVCPKVCKHEGAVGSQRIKVPNRVEKMFDLTCLIEASAGLGLPGGVVGNGEHEAAAPAQDTKDLG